MSERADPARPPSGTARRLRRLLVGIVILTLITGGLTLLTASEEHAHAAAANRAAVAEMQATSAYEALADADRQSLTTIPAGAGPAGQYQDDISAAEQSLEQVAENNVSGTSGTSALQLVVGLLAAYSGLVEQADGRYRTVPPGSRDADGVEDLWSASELLHEQILVGSAPDGSVSWLAGQARSQGTAGLVSPWTNPWMNLLWAVPALALIVLLAYTQLVLGRRLRRWLSICFVASAAVVIAMGIVVTTNVLASENALRAASGGSAAVVAAKQHEAATTDLAGQGELTKLTRGCRGCANTVESQTSRWEARDRPESRARPACDTRILSCETRYGQQSAAALAGYWWSVAASTVLMVALLLLIPVRMWSYLDTYRFRRA